jgi:drug/metabolite transporter (DMT)-like permease
MHKYILLKAILVLSSWILGYFAMKNLPLTIVGPINATRPVMVLVGALLVFGERLNGWQWAGVLMAILSYFLLRKSGKKEGIDFRHDKWIYMTIGAAMLGAVSGLYDKFLMAPEDQGGVGLDRMMVQSWFTLYQCMMMVFLLLVMWWPKHHTTTPFHWSWAIIGVSVFLSAADFMYFYSLSIPDAMISVVSMVRRGSVIVSFMFGVVLFHERNLRAKALDLALMLLGLLFLYIGSE